MMNIKPRYININNSEFDWLGYCTSCNVECCHNIDPSIPKYECTKPGMEKNYMTNINKDALIDKMETTSKISKLGASNDDINDYRPIGCQIFPFDVMDLDGRLEWVKRNHCHATPALNYEKFIDFFERQFYRKWSLDKIKQYVEQDKLNNPEKYTSNNFKRIRELKLGG